MQILMTHMDKLIYFLLTTVLIGAGRYYFNQMQDSIKELHGKLDTVLQMHNQCRAELPEKYATKSGLERAHNRLDDTAQGLSRLEGVLNGRS